MNDLKKDNTNPKHSLIHTNHHHKIIKAKSKRNSWETSKIRLRRFNEEKFVTFFILLHK